MTKEEKQSRLNLARERFNELYPNYPPFDSSHGTLYQPITILNKANSRLSNSARIDSFSKLELGQGAIIGDLVHIASFFHLIGGGLFIAEDGSAFSSGSKIVTGSNIPGYDRGCSAVDPNAIISRGFVWCKEKSFVATGAIVLPGCIIGVGSVVGAGSVVLSHTDIPDWEIWGGNPARFIKRLEKE